MWCLDPKVMVFSPAAPNCQGYVRLVWRLSCIMSEMQRSVLSGCAQVLEEGALQPVIGLLSSSCTESQRESALLLGQFATTDHEFKAKIVQRGAVPPLITMLGSADVQLKEMAAFALGRLAQNVDNQAGIVQVRSCSACSCGALQSDALLEFEAGALALLIVGPWC